MINRVLLIIAIFISTSCCAQKKGNDVLSSDVYFHVEKGDSSYYVLKSCKEYIQKHKDGKYKIEAICDIGRAYIALKMEDSAIRYFKNTFTYPEDWDIVDYQNESARYIASIFISKKSYDSALYYLDMAKKKYPFHSWGPIENYIYYTWDIGMHSAECYKGKGQYLKAIDELEIFISGGSPFTSSDPKGLMDNLYALYIIVYPKDTIKKEFINAAKTITVHKRRDTSSSTPIISTYVTLFGKKISFDNNEANFAYILNNKPDTITNKYLRKLAEDSFKHTYIYKLATQ